MLAQENLLIDGKLVPAAGGKVFETVNPATEQVLGTAADATAEDVDAAIAAARRAFDTGSWATDPAFRASCIRQLRDALVAAAGLKPGPKVGQRESGRTPRGVPVIDSEVS